MKNMTGIQKSHKKWKIRLNTDRVLCFLDVLCLCLFGTLSTLEEFLLPRFLRFFMWGIIAFYAVYRVSSLAAQRCRMPAVTTTLLLAMAVIYFIRNAYLRNGQETIVVYLGMLLLCFQAFRQALWRDYVLNILEIIYLIYAVATIAFFFMPSFYTSRIATLFPDSTSSLIRLYNQGCMAGLTSHYSTNGMFLSAGVFVEIALFIRRKDVKKLLSGAFLAIMVIALLMTGKRAHTLFTVMALMAVYYVYDANRRCGRLFKVIALLMVAIFAFYLLSFYVPSLGIFWQRFLEAFNSDDVTNGRMGYWMLALSLFTENPLLGIGWGQFQSLSVDVLGRPNHAHMVFLQLLCETGIIGFIIYCAWFVHMLRITVAVFTEIRRSNLRRDPQANAHMVFSLGYQVFFLLYCFTGNPLYERMTFVPYFFACAIAIFYRSAIRRCPA